MSISDKTSMFYNAKPIIFERAKTLCEHMTPAEKTVWELLKSKKMLELRFKPIENNINHIQNEIERICIERRSELLSPP